MTKHNPRLKVYVTRIGLHETIVAAPSQRAALEAWGAEQDLFSKGKAWDTRDPDTCAAALPHPGVVLARPLGSDKPYKPVSTRSKRAATEGDGP